MANEYATLDQLKQWRRTNATQHAVNPDSNEVLSAKLTAASRAIDRKTGRDAGGFLTDSTPTARQFRTDGATLPQRDGELLLIDEVANLGGLLVESGDGTSWTAVTDYAPEPLGAIGKGRPVSKLRRVRSRWCADQVRVTAQWGWPAVPDEIVEATLLLANRLKLRVDSPEGVAGSAEWGVLRLSRWDPDVETLIGPYVLPGFG